MQSAMPDMIGALKNIYIKSYCIRSRLEMSVDILGPKRATSHSATNKEYNKHRCIYMCIYIYIYIYVYIEGERKI